eukprot:COSAG06_NODE_1786_length_8400_cov_4.794121_9_plen_68_part_00
MSLDIPCSLLAYLGVSVGSPTAGRRGGRAETTVPLPPHKAYKGQFLDETPACLSSHVALLANILSGY